MQRLVQYGQSALQLYKTYPLIVVFCIDKVSPSTMMAEVQTAG